MKFENTKLNYEELKKDVKGIAKGIKTLAVSTLLTVKDAATLVTLSPLRDFRNSVLEKKAESEEAVVVEKLKTTKEVS